MVVPNHASLAVASSKADVAPLLNAAIVKICVDSLKARGVFCIALSGGSNASFLSDIDDAFKGAGEDPKYDCWHVILADERCVPDEDPDSNLGLLREKFLSKVSIPANQVHGIDHAKLEESSDVIAKDYEKTVKKALQVSGGLIDLAVLGFGPDGHTCSLFPGHELLTESQKWVAGIDDSPKPPAKRITLTFPVLNSKTRHVIFCGAGNSKSPILKKIFSSVSLDTAPAASSESVSSKRCRYKAKMAVPPPYPCAMVSPNTSSDFDNSVEWVVDTEALSDVIISE
jgi:6-phosphogluconolactonase